MGDEGKQIYFITDGKFVKIGISNDVNQRLKALQTANPRQLELLYSIKGDSLLEESLHGIFTNSRVKGEWFELDESIYSFINLFKLYDYSLVKNDDNGCLIPEYHILEVFDKKFQLKNTGDGSKTLMIVYEKIISLLTSKGLSLDGSFIGLDEAEILDKTQEYDETLVKVAVGSLYRDGIISKIEDYYYLEGQ